MSVAAQQPRKRGYFDTEENEDRLQRLYTEGLHPGHQKRVRGGPGASPSGRCAPNFQAAAAAYSVGSGTLSALAALFPEMSDKVIADVLAEYGDNIDAAIKHLTQLRLGQAALAVEAGDGQRAAQGEQGEQPPQQQQTQPGAEGKEAQQQAQQTQHAQQQQQQQQQQQPAGQTQQQQQQQRSAEEWVDVVVQQMGAAADLADARRRASSALQAFEQAVLAHARGGEAEALRGQLAEALRENGLLKRAVAIQNARLQELAPGGGGGGGEAAQLRQALQDMSAKCHALEVQNYSLALHLRQATDSKDPAAAAGTPHFKNPDVF